MFSHEWHNSINDLGWPYQDQTHLRSERHRQIDWSRPVLVINPSSSLIIRPSFSDTCQEKTAQHWHILDAKNTHKLDFAVFYASHIWREYFNHQCTVQRENMLEANHSFSLLSLHGRKCCWEVRGSRQFFKDSLAEKKLNSRLPPPLLLLALAAINSFVRLGGSYDGVNWCDLPVYTYLEILYPKTYI